MTYHNINELTTKDIEEMNYVQFISLLKETNRCPGGKHSIAEILKNTFINRSSKVLEIGSNTGFTSLEIARCCGCSVVGIDPVSKAVAVAQEELSKDVPAIQEKVVFMEGSAYEIPFSNNEFDLVITGGATSFMDEKESAVSEYYRVIKPWGFLSVTNLFYHRPPPLALLDKLSSTLGVTIKPWGLNQWLNVFEGQKDVFERYDVNIRSCKTFSHSEILQYVSLFLEKPHLKNLEDDLKNTIKNRWIEILSIFNENHKYLNYFLALWRKRAIPEEPILFAQEGGIL